MPPDDPGRYETGKMDEGGGRGAGREAVCGGMITVSIVSQQTRIHSSLISTVFAVCTGFHRKKGQ